MEENTWQVLGSGCFLEKDDLKQCQAWLALLVWPDAEREPGVWSSLSGSNAVAEWQLDQPSNCQEARLATKCSHWSRLCVAA